MATLFIPLIVLRAINHLIEQEKWARDLLLRHDHKIVAVELPFGSFRLLIQDGLLQDAKQEDIESSVSLEISQEAFWAFVKDGKGAAMKFVRISGDVDLAADLNRLFAELRWEAEEDLSKLIGDAPSRRIIVESKKVFTQANNAVEDLKSGVRDFFVNERNILLGANQFNDFKSEIRLLRDQLDRAEKKLNHIEQRINNKETQ
jgi:ubiquinone biosynthesis protein UbiJ